MSPFEILRVLSDEDIDELSKRYNVWVANHYNTLIIDRQVIFDGKHYSIFIFTEDIND